MDEKKTTALQEAQTTEMGTVTVGETPKKKKTGLFAPILSIIAGALAWLGIFFSEQLENFQKLIKALSGNQEMLEVGSELGEVSGNFWGSIISNFGWVILLVVLLIVFTIIGVVGICKLITRICRRTKNKFTKED